MVAKIPIGRPSVPPAHPEHPPGAKQGQDTPKEALEASGGSFAGEFAHDQAQVEPADLHPQTFVNVVLALEVQTAHPAGVVVVGAAAAVGSARRGSAGGGRRPPPGPPPGPPTSAGPGGARPRSCAPPGPPTP